MLTNFPLLNSDMTEVLVLGPHAAFCENGVGLQLTQVVLLQWLRILNAINNHAHRSPLIIHLKLHENVKPIVDFVLQRGIIVYLWINLYICKFKVY